MIQRNEGVTSPKFREDVNRIGIAAQEEYPIGTIGMPPWQRLTKSNTRVRGRFEKPGLSRVVKNGFAQSGSKSRGYTSSSLHVRRIGGGFIR